MVGIAEEASAPAALPRTTKFEQLARSPRRMRRARVTANRASTSTGLRQRCCCLRSRAQNQRTALRAQRATAGERASGATRGAKRRKENWPSPLPARLDQPSSRRRCMHACCLRGTAAAASRTSWAEACRLSCRRRRPRTSPCRATAAARRAEPACWAAAAPNCSNAPTRTRTRHRYAQPSGGAPTRRLCAAAWRPHRAARPAIAAHATPSEWSRMPHAEPPAASQVRTGPAATARPAHLSRSLQLRQRQRRAQHASAQRANWTSAPTPRGLRSPRG
mmetsp:Transcript_2632/g.5928  ORF Transcript_2632/g.5928 Transcript_2632/m.5928 type:complete len:277 (-) Transcript_2632:1514-2344(-)